MKKSILSGMVLAAWMVSCASTKNETVISPYSASQPPAGQSALVYGLPQTRLYFEVELVKTMIRKGPYAEYASRMLGLQNVPTKDSESWQVQSVRISDRQEVDSKQLYTVSFTDYPQNLDRLLRFTKAGLLLDLTVNNVLMNNRNQGKSGDDFPFANTSAGNTVIGKVDTAYSVVLTDTAYIRIPVLQRKVIGKSVEEQAREAADQIFDIRKNRYESLIGVIDYKGDGAALKYAMQSLDTQEAQLLSLFSGVKTESRQIVTYTALPAKPETSNALFYFSDKSGIVSKNTAGAKEVWYEIGKVVVPPSITPNQQANNIIYYRIPQIVEVSAGVDKNILAGERVTVCQFGNIVSFPLVAQPAKK